MRADALLGSTDKVTSLAALADSADYLADVIARSGAIDVGGGGAGPRSVSPTKAAGGGGGGGRDGMPSGALTVGMAHLMDRSAALCGTLDGSLQVPGNARPLSHRLDAGLDAVSLCVG